MYKIYVVLLMVAMLVTTVNLIFAKTADPSVSDLMKLAVYTLPIQYLIGLGYAYYYSKGIETFSYATLSISAYPVLIAISVLAHVLFFKQHTFTTNEALGIMFTGMGIMFFMMDKVKIKL